MHDPGRRRRPPARGARRRRPPARRPPPPRRPAPRRAAPPVERPDRERRKRESGSFEIRQGRSGFSSEDLDEDEPLEQIVLPQSITQEAEEGNFVKRFGASPTFDLGGRSGKVLLQQSGGASGPDRYLRRRKIVIGVLVLLAAAAGAGYAFWPQLQAYLGR